jgi:hypothetical protein
MDANVSGRLANRTPNEFIEDIINSQSPLSPA